MSIFSSVKHLDAYGRLTGSFYQLNLIYTGHKTRASWKTPARPQAEVLCECFMQGAIPDKTKAEVCNPLIIFTPDQPFVTCRWKIFPHPQLKNIVGKRPTECQSFFKNYCPLRWLKLCTVVFWQKWALLGVRPVKTSRNIFEDDRFWDLSECEEAAFQWQTQQFLQTLLVECVWKHFSTSWRFVLRDLEKIWGSFTAVSAVWGWRGVVLFNFKQHARSSCDTEKTCVGRLKHQFGQGVKGKQFLRYWTKNWTEAARSLLATSLVSVVEWGSEEASETLVDHAWRWAYS